MPETIENSETIETTKNLESVDTMLSFQQSTEVVFEARAQWIVALASLPKERVFTLAGRLAASYDVQPASVSQGGLALLPLRESVQRQTFYLGEVPFSSSHLELRAPDGTTVFCAAQVMADDADYADALAICDGILSHRLPGWEEVAAHVTEGLSHLRDLGRLRNTMLTRTRVNFSLLNEDE